MIARQITDDGRLDTGSPTAVAAGSAVKSRRRQAAKRYHPDRGGDPTQFISVMQGLAEVNPRPSLSVTVTSRHPLVREFGAARRRFVYRLRQRLPRSWPGSRRYGHL